MADHISECPFCRGQFRVPTDTASDRMLCPHCRQVVELYRLSAETGATPADPIKLPIKTGSPNVEATVMDCPNCSGKFKVLASMRGQSVACPHCRKQLQIPPPSNQGAVPSDFKIQTHEPSATVPAQSSGAQIAAVAGPPIVIQVSSLDPELEKLLPPKFFVPNSLQNANKSLGAAHVILPDAQGGFKTVDTSVRQVRFAGQTVTIASIPESRKRRRRMIRSIAVFTVCAFILLATFYLLSR